MAKAKIEEGVRMILEGVGEDPTREGLRETPARVARMYEEVFAGLEIDNGTEQKARTVHTPPNTVMRRGKAMIFQVPRRNH